MYSKKQELDKFYTNPKIVLECLKYLDLTIYDLIIEPSAGNGSFSNELKNYNFLAYDVQPDNNYIIKKDWFEVSISKEYSNVLILGNPPFGKRNRLSQDFLKHSFSFSNVNTVAFILPNVYKKYTQQKIIPKEFRIKEIIDLPNKSFLLNNIEYHVPCSFFIFDKSNGQDLRFDISKYQETSDFEWGTKIDYDFFIFGASPSKIIKIPNKNNRGYYIKSKINIEILKEKIKNTNWQKNSSANGGVAWLTKVEIIKSYKETYF